jgi:hypothetical protein
MRFLVSLWLVGCAAESVPVGPSSVVTNQGLYELTLVPDQAPWAASEEVSMEISIAADGQLTDAALALDFWMPDHGHGLSGEPVIVPVSTGIVEASWTFSMSGYWEITLDVDGPAGTDTAVTGWEVQ